MPVEGCVYPFVFCRRTVDFIPNPRDGTREHISVWVPVLSRAISYTVLWLEMILGGLGDSEAIGTDSKSFYKYAFIDLKYYNRIFIYTCTRLFFFFFNCFVSRVRLTESGSLLYTPARTHKIRLYI